MSASTSLSTPLLLDPHSSTSSTSHTSPQVSPSASLSNLNLAGPRGSDVGWSDGCVVEPEYASPSNLAGPPLSAAGPAKDARPVRQRPACRSVSSLCLVTFLYWCGVSSTWAPFSELLLRRACTGLGLSDSPDSDQCSAHATENATMNHTMNTTAVHLYKLAQQQSSSEASMFLVLQAVAALITVPGVGVLSDAFGRRAALIFPCLGGLAYGLSVYLVPAMYQNTWLLGLTTLARCSGGTFATTDVVFASLADITQVRKYRVHVY